MALNAAFFDAVRKTLFDGKLSQEQVNVLNAIADAWRRYGDKFGYDQYRLAYVMATAYHETGRFRWLREIWGPTAAQKRYEGRADLGNTQPGDGKRFMGRGLVHITGRRNYADWSRRLDIDLTADPQRAEELGIAARILVEGMVLGTFTGKKLQDYINSDGCDYVGARRIVNGTDRAGMIAGYAEAFSAALGLADDAQAAPNPPVQPVPATPPEQPPVRSPAPVAAIVIIILALAAAGAFFFVRF